MSAILVARRLGCGLGDRVLFRDLDLVVAAGDVIGLVGVNGAGKTTVLRTLAGLIEPDEGSVRLTPASASIGYLPQEPDRRPGESVRGFLNRRTGVAAAQAALDAAARQFAEGPAAEQYQVALERWLALGGADLEERAAAVAAEVGVELDHPMLTVSGGQAARASLGSLLLSRYDVFLLDEPTNDLDLDGLRRLEEFVSGLQVGVVLVSHDREFLAHTVTRVVELDLAQQQVRTFGGGYDAYRLERARARTHERQAYEEYAARRTALEARAREQRAWMEKGVRNARRKATDHDTVGRRFRAESSEKQAAKARQTERLIERLPAVEEPRKEWQLQLAVAAAPRSGAVVAFARGAVVQRGAFTLGPVNLEIGWQDRVAITGPNGAGKTTLLALLLGRIAADVGSAGLGSGVVVGEVDQTRRLFAGDDSLMAAFGTLMPEVLPGDVRTLLAKFDLRADHVLRPASTLSPGERTRAALALLQLRGVNLLVLDEPTNHLDLPAIEQLEAALAHYQATLLLVTHDRRMLESVRITRRLTVAGGGVTDSGATV